MSQIANGIAVIRKTINARRNQVTVNGSEGLLHHSVGLFIHTIEYVPNIIKKAVKETPNKTVAPTDCESSRLK